MKLTRRQLLSTAAVLAVPGALALLRFRPWESAQAQEALTVGYLPVTCHLTCPVTDYASRSSRFARFDSQRYLDFPTMVEAIKSGRLQASFMVVPLAMKLREQGVPVKLVYLGHREGSTLMVRAANPATDLAALRGTSFAIPTRYSNQNLVLHRLMAQQGLTETDLKIVELPPPDMPGALAAGAIEGYFVGEPMAAKAELAGTGRVLYHAHAIWPGFISCGLVVHEELIERKPALIADLVRGIAQSGQWIEHHRPEAAAIAAPYYRQEERLLRHVLTDPGRVSYVNLTPQDADLQAIHTLAVQLGILTQPLRMSELIDRRFVPGRIDAIELAPPERPA
ncbi:MAG TPA: ABC transporter substrate-binding protein [Plasticicumulans sp.]|nr:ABC transporter substrate-binding protein [Plasticicumulans sp.]